MMPGSEVRAAEPPAAKCFAPLVRFGCLVGILGLGACEKIDPDPPQFEGIHHIAAVHASAVSVHWRPASDRQNHADEIRYGIWIAPDGEDVDLQAPPRVLTEEGALSYAVDGLEPETTYSVWVRAIDRGDNASENPESQNITTPTSETAPWTPYRFQLANQTLPGLVRGYASTISGLVVGLFSDTTMHWYAWQNQDMVEVEEWRIQLESPPQGAVCLMGEEASFLWVLGSAWSAWYRLRPQHNAEPWDAGPLVSQVLPETAVIACMDDDEHQDLVFGDASGWVHIWTGDGDGGFQAWTSFPAASPLLALTVHDLDQDRDQDIAILSSTEWGCAFNDDGFSLHEVHDLNLSESVPLGLCAVSLNGDALPDMVVLVRDEPAHETLLLRWTQQGSGDFDRVDDMDLWHAWYSCPQSGDLNGDTWLDLAMIQTHSNDVVILLGGSQGLVQPDFSLGHDPHPGEVQLADLNGDGHTDVLILNEAGDQLAIFLRNPI